ncbi:MAG: ABC transporter ATP-binding protein [Chthonomonadales bacterium]|nr:ABC transporter ATP-binding protein [Chthonomonadales bacterium]
MYSTSHGPRVDTEKGGGTLKVEISGLRKEYEGGVVGLHETSLTIGEGIFALLGPNGAGKSTLMSMLTTLLEPTGGTATVDGYDIRKQKDDVRAILGYLPQDFGLYPSLTVFETLDYIGLLYNLKDNADREARISNAMRRVNLTDVRARLIAHLSGGMRQRVGLAQAILNDPKLLIVDEPTAGLDPEERIRVRSMLTELGRDRVVILSTHLIEDVAAVADIVAILHKGRIRFVGTPAGMRDTVRDRVWEIRTNADSLAEMRHGLTETSLQREGDSVLIRVISDAPPTPEARQVEPTLDDAYIGLMGAGDANG